MTNNDHIRLIEAYYQGTLTGNDKSLFKELMREDAEFKVEVKAYKKIFKGLGGLHLDHLQNQMNAWESNQTKQETVVVSLSPFRKYMAIAAAIAMLFCVPLVYQSLGTTDPFEQHFQASTSFAIHTASVRDSKNLAAHETIKGLAFSAYQKENYKETIKQLKDYINNFEEEAAKDAQSYLVLGIAQIAEGQYEAASSNLVIVMKKQEVSYKQEAEWMWALAQYKLGNIDAAKDMLQKITKKTKHDHKKSAQEFLNSL